MNIINFKWIARSLLIVFQISMYTLNAQEYSITRTSYSDFSCDEDNQFNFVLGIDDFCYGEITPSGLVNSVDISFEMFCGDYTLYDSTVITCLNNGNKFVHTGILSPTNNTVTLTGLDFANGYYFSAGNFLDTIKFNVRIYGCDIEQACNIPEEKMQITAHFFARQFSCETPSVLNANFGDSCFWINSLRVFDGPQWFSFRATSNHIDIEACGFLAGISFKILTGECGNFTELFSDSTIPASGFNCTDSVTTSFDGLTPGNIYTFQATMDYDCHSNDGAICIRMPTPCKTDLLLTGIYDRSWSFQNYKTITLNNFNLAINSWMSLGANEEININPTANISLTSILFTNITGCVEMTCGDGFDDDEDGLADDVDPDCN